MNKRKLDQPQGFLHATTSSESDHSELADNSSRGHLEVNNHNNNPQHQEDLVNTDDPLLLEMASKKRKQQTEAAFDFSYALAQGSSHLKAPTTSHLEENENTMDGHEPYCLHQDNSAYGSNCSDKELNDLDETFLSSKLSPQQRENLRTKTKDFVRQQKINEQQYVIHASKYVSSIAEVNRIVNTGEWFGSAEIERSVVDENSKLTEAQNPSTAFLTYSQQQRRHTFPSNLSHHALNQSSPLSSPLTNEDSINNNHAPELVFLPKVLCSIIKPHQLEALRFCWNSVVLPPDDDLKGCILGHSTGLGKTLTIIVFCYLYLKHHKGKRILIVCPRSVIQNWEREIASWMHNLKLDTIPCFVLDHGKDLRSHRLEKLADWSNRGGILLMCFSSFSRWTESQQAGGAHPQQQFSNNVGFQAPLHDSHSHNNNASKIEFEKQVAEYLRKCDLAVLDEGHRMKNPTTNLSHALYSNILTRKRIVLTGVPPQFNLMEYFTIIDWVRPGYWSMKEFKHLFCDPISLSLQDLSNVENREQMRKRFFILMQELSLFVHRKDQSVLKSYLPPKKEYVLYFHPTDIQSKLYNRFIESRRKDLKQTNIETSFNEEKQKREIYFMTVMTQKILNHPDLILQYCRDNKKLFETNNALVGESSQRSSMKLFLEENADDSHELSYIPTRSTCISETIATEEDTSLAPSVSNTMFNMLEEAERFKDTRENMEWAKPVLEKSYYMNMIDNSPKMLCLIRMIEQCFLNFEKLLVFSQYQETLDAIERIITNVNITTGLPLEDESQPLKRKLKRNVDFYRLDDSMSVSLGQSVVDSFNSSSDAPLLLISTKVGALGIDLSSSQKIVLFDVCWDNTWDNHAVFRSFRYGQTKPVSIYRFVMDNTIESKIFQRVSSRTTMFKNMKEEKKNFVDKEDFSEYLQSENTITPSASTTFQCDAYLEKVMTSEPRLKKYVQAINEYESLYIELPDELSSQDQTASKQKYDQDFSDFTSSEARKSSNCSTSSYEESNQSGSTSTESYNEEDETEDDYEDFDEDDEQLQ
nr:unnamed protein product [Naegleria fowleri]